MIPSKSKRPAKVHLITFATHPKAPLTKLVERGQKLGFQVQVIGLGTPWKGFGHRMKAYHQTIHEMIEGKDLKYVDHKHKSALSDGHYLKEKCQTSDLVILVDGYDIIPFGTSGDVIDAFERYGTDVLISAEGNCTPYMIPGQDPFKLYTPSLTGRPFLNAGGIMGKALALMNFLKDVITTRKIADNDDDQAAITQYYLDHVRRENERRRQLSLCPTPNASNPIPCQLTISHEGARDRPALDHELSRDQLVVKVCLDTNCEVFQCSEFDEDVLVPQPSIGLYGRYQNSRTNTYPAFLHLPGKPALLNLGRVYECRRLLLPREIIEAVCKGVTLETQNTGGQDGDPLDRLEAFVRRYGEEASLHIQAGMRVQRAKQSSAVAL